MRVAVVGQGYVGLPLAIRSVASGHTVVGFDVSKDRIGALTSAQSPIEDISDAELAAAHATGRYLPTTEPKDLAGFDVAVVSVPTPLRDGAPDLGYVESAAETIGGFVRAGSTVILESTTYPGTTEELFGPTVERESGLIAGRDFHLGYSPERVDPGNDRWQLRNTPKVVAGLTPSCLAAVRAFFDSIVERTVPVSSLRVAELTKLIENTYRHVNIALVNELAMFSHDLGIDVWEALEAAATKPFGFQKFRPGPGVGGHCLPIDPLYLSWRVQRHLGHDFRFIQLAQDINAHMPDYVVSRLIEAFNQRDLPIKGRRILLFGLSYKPNSADTRETPSRQIASLLVALGADVRVADPLVRLPELPVGATFATPTPEEAGAADALVVLVDHDGVGLQQLADAAPYVFDTRRAVTGAHVEYL